MALAIKKTSMIAGIGGLVVGGLVGAFIVSQAAACQKCREMIRWSEELCVAEDFEICSKSERATMAGMSELARLL